MKIAVVGAFDRYNYGDLVMPLIVKREIEKTFTNQKIEFDFYGLAESNMEYCCGINTKKLLDIYKTKYDGVILDGGDILSVTWSDMYLNLQSNKVLIYIFKCLRKISYDFSNKVARKILKGQTYSPWVLDKSKLNCNYLIYNTVDGKISNQQLKKIYNDIKQIDYISIRNYSVYEEIKKLNENCYMFPDSVINLSKTIDGFEIESHVSNEIKNFVKNNDYYIFQCKKKIGKENFEDIVEGILNVDERINLKCLLLPIGFAQGHEDQVILKKINKTLKNTYFFENINIYEIMYLIKNSKLFIGTSLHGLITSISYGIPHMAYTNKIEKQIKFLNTWKTTSIIYTDSDNMCQDINFIMKNYENEKKKVEQQNKKMQSEVDKNFKEIINILSKGIKNG